MCRKNGLDSLYFNSDRTTERIPNSSCADIRLRYWKF